MNKTSLILLLLTGLVGLSSCGKQKKIEALESQLALKTEQAEQLETQLEHLQTVNSGLLDQMADLSIVSKTGAESIKQSLDNISTQYGFIQDLTQKIQKKDSINLALVMNLKRSLSDLDNDDIQVEVRGGRVHVSISDKMLFSSGSSRLSENSQNVLNNLSLVLNDHRDLEVIVEGHTDDVPISGSCVADNWDLSVRRATAVVRALQDEYFVDPERLTAAGRAEYAPRADNSSSDGRSINRRTEIVITPKLDQFFKLLEAPALVD